MNSKVIFSGDTSINVVFENVVSEKISNQVLSIAKLVERQHINGLVDIIPAYREVTFVFDPLVLDIASFKHFLEKQLNKMDGEIVDKNGRHYDIPVLYNDEVGLDLLEVAKYHGLSLEEVIHLHTAQAYRIYMLGFYPVLHILVA